MAKRQLDQQFRFRPGHEDIAADQKVERPKLLLPGNVGERLSIHAPYEQIFVALRLGARNIFSGSQDELFTSQSEGTTEQQLGIETSAVDAGSKQSPDALHQNC